MKEDKNKEKSNKKAQLKLMDSELADTPLPNINKEGYLKKIKRQ